MIRINIELNDTVGKVAIVSKDGMVTPFENNLANGFIKTFTVKEVMEELKKEYEEAHPVECKSGLGRFVQDA